jgi:beta-lactam-binding protein with PASTA domain
MIIIPVTALIEDEDLIVGTITYECNDTCPAGTVIRVNPPSGSTVPCGSSVDLVISTGQPVVPNVDDPNLIILPPGLDICTIHYECSDTVPAGGVISQDPAGGTTVPCGTCLNLVISAGPAVVPNVVGELLADANAAIIAASLVVGSIDYECSDTVAAGRVIHQNPLGGETVNAVVPNVVGELLADANAAIIAASLVVGSIDYECSDTVAAGRVISQNPLGGERVVCGSAVDMVVSTGQPTVPTVVGLPVADANATIISAGLTVCTTTYVDDCTVPAGQVISQDPAGGSTADCGSCVDLEVSTGQTTVPPIPLCDTAILPATALIEAEYLIVGTVTYECNDTCPEGTVIRVDPPSGSTVPCGSIVDLVISTGPPMVPDVVGLDQASAEAAINAVANLSVGTITTACSDTVPAGDVMSQDPVAGPTTCNDTVDLVISTGQHVVTATSGANGSIDPNGAVAVNCGGDLQLCATPDICYEVDIWYVDGNSVQVGGDCYTLSNVTSSHTVHVTFKQLQYTVTVPCAVPNGSINPCGEITVDCGGDLELCVTPAPCYEVDTWYVDGNSVQTGGNCYTLSNVMGNHTVSVTFKLIQYTLTIEIVGCGSVTKDPNKAIYDCNECVELTAIPCPGWEFAGWSGGLSGGANPDTICLGRDKALNKALNETVTATFTLIEPVCGECDGQTYEWTNAYIWSYLWVSPWNWDPTPLYGGPGIADTVVIGLDPVPAGPVLDTDIDICRIYGPAQQATGDQAMYVIKDANVVVCKNWIVQESVPHTGTIWIQDDAMVSIGSDDGYSFHAHGDHQRVIINMTDNASMVMDCDMRVGDEGDDYFELNMTDSAFLHTGDCEDGFRHNDGGLQVDLSGNAILESESVRWRSKTELINVDVTIRENAQFIITDGSFQSFGGSSIYTMDVLDNGVFDVQDGDIRLGEDNDFDTTITINMSGQLIHSSGHFWMIYNDDADGFTTVNLDSGVIDTEGEIRAETDNWVVNICGDGVWIVDGDRVDETLAEADDGHWRACPEEDCRGEIVDHGTLMVDYDNVNPGRTTIWSELDLTIPWSPIPVDGATDVGGQGVELCWCPPEVEGGIKDQHVWFSTDCEAVANRNPEAFLQQAGTDTCVDVGCLELCTTYCWAVDTQDHYANIVRGPVWTFTTECCRMIEPFDQYTLDPWGLIYKAWFDGCGYWDILDGDPVLISNGTGSCVNLGMDNTQDGPKAMIYTYENDEDSLWDRCHNYSEASREFDPALDLECSNDKALVIWFYGDGDNDLTDMWLKLSDGAGTVKSTYGANGEDPANIRIAEWQDWNTKISDLAAIDLSAVTEMALGFGDDETNVPDDTYGLMLFDSIQVCGTRCVPQFVVICDLNDDCIVDWKDVKIIGESWLEDRR